MKKRKRDIFLLGKVWAIIFGLILGLIGVGVGFIWIKLNKINRVDKYERTKLESAVKDRNILNILLIGEDKRPGEGRTSSDSVIIMTIDKSKKVVKLTSLMRDLYVEIPGYGNNRMNVAYASGGIELLVKTINQNFDIDIDGSIKVDFSGFRKVIDNIGGIELNISEDEVDVLNSYIKECNEIFGENEKSNLLTQAGLQKLNGLQALAHSRSRYIESGDFGRTERQREILIAVSKQIEKMGLSAMLTTADAVLPLLTTDMKNIDLIKLGIALCKTGINNIETHNIPVEGSFEFEDIGGVDVLVPDIDICKQALKEIIYEE